MTPSKAAEMILTFAEIKAAKFTKNGTVEPGSFSQLPWRHHGLGMLQAELSHNTRVHVWHYDLQAPWRDDPLRAVHDHRWDLTSFVVTGALTDVTYEVWPFEQNLWNAYRDAYPEQAESFDHSYMWEIVNAKAQAGMDPGKVGERVMAVIAREIGRRAYRKGESYSLPRRVFHTTEPEPGVMVTLVGRTNFDDRPARVLGRTAHSGIQSDTDPELIAEIARIAQWQLERVSGRS